MRFFPTIALAKGGFLLMFSAWLCLPLAAQNRLHTVLIMDQAVPESISAHLQAALEHQVATGFNRDLLFSTIIDDRLREEQDLKGAAFREDLCRRENADLLVFFFITSGFPHLGVTMYRRNGDTENVYTPLRPDIKPHLLDISVAAVLNLMERLEAGLYEHRRL